MLTIELPDELGHHFAPLAKAAGKTTEAYVRDFLMACKEDMEDYQDAVEEYEKVRSGESRLWTSDEMRKELGLDD